MGRGGWWLALVAACAGGACATEELVVGEYRLEIDPGAGWSPGPRLSLAADGSFTGHPEGTRFECAGRLSDAEHAALTDALNAAGALQRPSNRQPCADHPVYHLEIHVVAGA